MSYKIYYETGGEWSKVDKEFDSEVQAEDFAFANLPHECLRFKRGSYEIVKECGHNSMVPNDSPENAWKCSECGYVYA